MGVIIIPTSVVPELCSMLEISGIFSKKMLTTGFLLLTFCLGGLGGNLGVRSFRNSPGDTNEKQRQGPTGIESKGH